MHRLRTLLAVTFFAGAAGTAAELLLLEHVEDIWQQLPVALLAVACVLLVVVAVQPRPGPRKLFNVLMLAFVASGIAGVWLHYQGNVEFEREIDPEMAGLTLVWESMKGATPALAPGTMVLLGAVGFAYTRTIAPE